MIFYKFINVCKVLFYFFYIQIYIQNLYHVKMYASHISVHTLSIMLSLEYLYYAFYILCTYIYASNFVYFTPRYCNCISLWSV